MDMIKEYIDNIVLVKCERTMDINSLKDLDKALIDSLERKEYYIVLDLIETKFLDSIIAGKILAMLKIFRAKGGDIKLLNPQINVLQALKTLGIIGILEVYDSFDKIKQFFQEKELLLEEIEYIKRETTKNILVKYDRLCTDISIDDRIQAAIEGKYVPGIDRDLNIIDLFSEKNKIILYDNVEEFCESIKKYFSDRGLDSEKIKAMEQEIKDVDEYCDKVLKNHISIEDLYNKFKIGKYDAINRKLEQLKKMME